jgi:tRNA pseudouridine55 synthase
MDARDSAPEAGRLDRGGVLVIDKPPGPTSHDIVAVIRRRLRGAKIGHTGTLDPFATGVLPLVIGRATRLARYLTASDKEYDAVIRLGRTTDTHDVTGSVLSEVPPGTAMPGAQTLSALLTTFLGTWLQTPPAFSAKMSDGVRAYEQARRGVAVQLAPVQVTVHEIELLSVEGPLVSVRLVSSAGFYVRALAHDIGLRLGVGACLDALRRTRSGVFGLRDAVTLDKVDHDGFLDHLVPLEALLPDWPAVAVTSEGAARVGHGRDLEPIHCVTGLPREAGAASFRVLGPDGRLLALAEAAPGAVLHPTVVLV